MSWIGFALLLSGSIAQAEKAKQNGEFSADELPEFCLAALQKTEYLKDAEAAQLAALVNNPKTSQRARVAARDRLVQSMYPLIRKLAGVWKQRNRELNFSELFNEGVASLLKGIASFDSEKGKFFSYAHAWVNAGVVRATTDALAERGMLTTPAALKYFYNRREIQRRAEQGQEGNYGERLARAFNEFHEENFQGWLDGHLKTHRIKLTLKNKYEQLTRYGYRVVPEQILEIETRYIEAKLPRSADAQVVTENGEEAGLWIEQYSPEEAGFSEELVQNSELRSLVDQAVDVFRDQLSQQHRLIFEQRILPLFREDKEPKTLEALGKQLGVSRERARQVEAQINASFLPFLRERLEKKRLGTSERGWELKQDEMRLELLSQESR